VALLAQGSERLPPLPSQSSAHKQGGLPPPLPPARWDHQFIFSHSHRAASNWSGFRCARGRLAKGKYWGSAQAVLSAATQVPRETSSLHRRGPRRWGLPFGSAFFHRRVADIQVVSLFPFIPLKKKAKDNKIPLKAATEESLTRSRKPAGQQRVWVYSHAFRAVFELQGEGGSGVRCGPRSALAFPTEPKGTHLLFLQPLLLGLDVLLNSHVNELVLRLRLHHARALPAYHLDGFGDVDIAVQTCPRGLGSGN